MRISRVLKINDASYYFQLYRYSSLGLEISFILFLFFVLFRFFLKIFHQLMVWLLELDLFFYFNFLPFCLSWFTLFVFKLWILHLVKRILGKLSNVKIKLQALDIRLKYVVRVQQFRKYITKHTDADTSP